MAQFASGSFTGADGTTLSTHDAAWTRHTSYTGDSHIISNRLRPSTDGVSSAYWHSGSPASADYSVSADVFAKETNGGLSYAGTIGRASTVANTFYMARYGGDTSDGWQLYKASAGAFTLLGSTSTQSLTDETAYNVKLEMIGTAIKLYKEGGGVATISQTDGDITAAGKAGFRFSGAAGDAVGLHLDNFSADDVAVSHPSTGSLVAASSTISGTGARVTFHPSSGALVSASSSISGTAANTPAAGSSHPSSGSLVSASSAISGTGAHIALHPSTGALAAASSTMSGTAAHIALHPSTGGLVSASASISGTAVNTPAAAPTTTATTLVLTKITGTFAAGDIKVGATTVGTCTGAQTINGALTALLRAQYTNLAADVYRALITAVPGSGSILGVWQFNDVVYAFRNVADGLSTAMYKSSSSGWTLVDLGRELSYTSGGTYTIAIGDTITGETSTATAVITAITVESGTLAAGTAAGRIIFASQTGTFQSETIKVGANLNVATIAGNSSAITFAVPGGRFKFGNYNFGTTKMYGVDSKNRGFEFDGTTFVPISTGMSPDTPAFLQEHKNHLFYAYSGSAQHSGIGTPYTWSVVSGAAELAMGDTITGFKVQSGGDSSAAMAIFTRNRIKILYGSSSSNWNLIPYREEAGAYAHTIQQIGGTMMLDDRGITTLVASQNYGNFADGTISKRIQTWINSRRSISVDSCIVRDKNQYRLFFSDGSALYATMDNGNPVGLMPIALPDIPTCVCSLENNSGNEVMYFGDSSGYVYQMDVGTSFDGADIDFYMDFAYNNFGSPRVLKSFKNGVIEVAGSGYAEFSFGSSLGYASTEIEQPSTQSAVASLTSSYWDSAIFDQFTWDGVSLLPSYFSMQGDSENISIKILGSSDYYSPLRFSGVLVNYIIRRPMR